MHVAVAVAPLMTAVILLAADAASASAPAAANGQESESSEGVTVTESFLLARNLGDFWGAAGWCESLVEVQDVDGSRFFDAATIRDWLRQLTAVYFIETVIKPQAASERVSWTERLTRRGLPIPDALPASVTVDIHARIRAGKIVQLGGPYPRVPFRRSRLAATEQGAREPSSSVVNVPPATLFVGSALGLVLAALVVRGCGMWLKRRNP